MIITNFKLKLVFENDPKDMISTKNHIIHFNQPLDASTNVWKEITDRHGGCFQFPAEITATLESLNSLEGILPLNLWSQVLDPSDRDQLLEYLPQELRQNTSNAMDEIMNEILR